MVYGLLKDADRPAAPDPQGDESDPSEAPAQPAAEAVKATGLSRPLVEELTALRTVALRRVLCDHPVLALRIVVHDLILKLFFEPWTVAGVALTEITTTRVDVVALCGGIAPGKAAAELDAIRARWGERMPGTPGELWEWLGRQPDVELPMLLALAVAGQVNGILSRQETGPTPKTRAADRLATAADLRMADWFRPDAAFFARLPKTCLLDALTAVEGAGFTQGLMTSKKAELAAIAERKLAGVWLPEPLLTPAADEA